MSVAADAIRILLSAKDDASAKFDDVGKSADSLRDRLANLGSGGLKGILEPIGSIASKFTAGAIAVKAFQSLVEGAGGAFKNSLTDKIDSAAAGAFKLTDGIGEAFKQASKVLPEDSWLKQIANYGKDFFSDGPRGLFGMWQAGIREIGSQMSGQKLPEPLDMPFIKADKRPTKDKIAWARQQQTNLQAEAQSIGAKEFKTVYEENRLKQIGSELARINNYVQILQKTPTGMARVIFGGDPAVKPKSRAALASGFTALDAFKSLMGGNVNAKPSDAHLALGGLGEFAKQAGQRRENVLREQSAANDAKLAQARGIVDSNLTGQERFDKEAKRLAEFKDMGAMNEDEFNRAMKNNRKRFLEPAGADNAAVTSRFGGGIVKTGDKVAEQAQKTRQEQLKEAKETRLAMQEFLKQRGRPGANDIKVEGGLFGGAGG